MAIKHVGVREFRDHANTYLAGQDTIAVERDGRVIGFYRPVTRLESRAGTRPEPAPDNGAAERLYDLIKQIAERNGMTEDEFVDYFLSIDIGTEPHDVPWARMPAVTTPAEAEADATRR